MKNRAKKNNKGFSLVELIVVVLIIGVIAVALAPSVMKWVGESKDNTDKNNAATLKSIAQAALADWQKDGGSIPKDEGSNTDAVFVIASESSLTITKEWTSDGGKKLSDYIIEAAAEEYVMPNNEAKTFEITVKKGSGKVEVKQVNKSTP